MEFKFKYIGYAMIAVFMTTFLLDIIKLGDRVTQLENMQCDNAYQYKED